MGVVLTVTHDLVAGVAVDAGHPLAVVDVVGQVQVEPPSGALLGWHIAMFVGGAVPLGLEHADIGYADAAATVVATDAVVVGYLFDHQRMRSVLPFLLRGGRRDVPGVRGESDPNVDLVIKITSPEGHQVLKQKGKVGGMLWMNVGQLKFENTPNFYELFSTKKIDDILGRDEMEKYTMGYAALQKHVEVAPVANEEEKTKWFNEFVRFKEDSKVYATSFGKIETKMNKDGRQDYYILTDWPYQAQPGDYLVSVYAVKNGKVVEQAEAKVNVEQVGMVKTLATMAKNNAAFYGFLSIGVALGAGFGVSLVFRKGGGAH